MAGDWIAVEYGTPEKPEMLAVAEKLQIDPDKVFARWFRVQCWADMHIGPDGHARGVTLSRLSHVAGLPGLAEAFAETGGEEAWLHQVEDGVVFRNFAKRNAKSGKVRLLAAERKRQQREREQKSHADVTQESRSDGDKSVPPLSSPPDPPSNPPNSNRTEELKSPPKSPPLPRGRLGTCQRAAYLLLENWLPAECQPEKKQEWLATHRALLEWLEQDEPKELLAGFLQEIPKLTDQNRKPWGRHPSRALVLGVGYRAWREKQDWDPEAPSRTQCQHCRSIGVPEIVVDGEPRCIVCLEPLPSPEPDVPP